MATSKISDNLLVQSSDTNQQILFDVENNAQQIQFLLDDLNHPNTRAICKHTINILRATDKTKLMGLSNIGFIQTLVKVADSARQIQLHLDDLDDPKMRAICKHTIDLLKATKQINSSFPQDVQNHENTGSSGAVIQGSLQVEQSLRQQGEQSEPSSITSKVESRPPFPTKISKPAEIENSRDGKSRPSAVIVQVNSSKRAAPEVQGPSPSKKLRPIASKSLGSAMKGQWVTIYISMDSKTPLYLDWLPSRIRNLILSLRDNLQDNYHYRNNNALANTPKPTTCWLSMYDAPMALRPLSNFEAPSDAGPCGMCRRRAELGENGVVCFYFTKPAIIKVFQVTSLT